MVRRAASCTLVRTKSVTVRPCRAAARSMSVFCSAVTRASRRCERVRPRAGFEANFGIFYLRPGVYGQCPATSRSTLYYLSSADLVPTMGVWILRELCTDPPILAVDGPSARGPAAFAQPLDRPALPTPTQLRRQPLRLNLQVCCSTLRQIARNRQFSPSADRQPTPTPLFPSGVRC